jgi:hypothetical protein
MKSHCGMMMLYGKIPDSSTKALWQSYQQGHLVEKQDKRGEEMLNFAYAASL